MASKSFELLPLTTLTSNRSSRADKIIDVGAYNTLQLHVLVAAASAGELLRIQTSALNEEDLFYNIGNTDNGDISLTNVGMFTVTITRFVRYIRWKTDTITGTPKIAVWGVAKE